MKNILITGSSRGIGRATALALMDRDYRFIINYKERKDMADSLVEIIRSNFRDAIAIQADIRYTDQVNAMFDQIESYCGPVDILINNAGIGSHKLFTDISEEEWLDVINVNVNGMYRCCQRAVPPMISKKSGVIINVSSIWGIIGGACEVGYSTTKGAINTFTKSLAKELGPSNIRVNCVAPGTVLTDMIKPLGPEVLDWVEEETPLGRVAEPSEVGETIKFLLSPGGDYMTGQILSPNGGFTIY